MKISIIHPTRGRKEQALKTMAKWLFNADSPYEIEYIFSTDIDDTDKWCSQIAIMPKFIYSSETKYIPVLRKNNRSAIEAIDKAVQICTGDLFIVISDDFDCPEHWDTLLLNELKDKQDFLLKTDDGLQPTLVTLPILDRVYYNRFGYVYHPDYKHLFSDQEMTAVALMIGKYIKSDLVFPHNHYSTGKFQKDEISVRNDLTWRQGETLFNERLKTNFGITEPVMQYSDIKWR